MSEPTIPGQLDTIIGQISELKGHFGSITQRLEDGDRRLNESDKTRAEMSDKLGTHTLMMADQSQHLNEQDHKLDGIGKAVEKLALAMEANTEITNIVKEAITTAKGSRTFAIWAAGFVGAAGTIYGGVQAFLHH